MMRREFCVTLYNEGRKVGGFVTQDSARVEREASRWKAGGNSHTVKVEERETIDQMTEEIPEAEYLCQATLQ